MKRLDVVFVVPLGWRALMFQNEMCLPHKPPIAHFRIGVLPGEGCGPELVGVALSLLERVAELSKVQFEVSTGGSIGASSAAEGRGYLPEDVVAFSDDIFSRGGVLLAGAGGGRFVYEMRRRFGLHYKLNPIRSYPELSGACRLKPPGLAKPRATGPGAGLLAEGDDGPVVDLLIVRENLQGLYHGAAQISGDFPCRVIEHTFRQAEQPVRDLLSIAVSAAKKRSGRLAVVCKESGLPELHSLWRECALEAAERTGVAVTLLDIDFASYKLLQDPGFFDVIAAPNCFGDILSDLGGVIMGSRGNTYGASFAASGAAVYQTNHGSAHDLAGTGRANPVGQIFSLAMMLRTSFQLDREAGAIEQAVRKVWREGWRTLDLPEPGTREIGAAEFGERVSDGMRLSP